MQDIPADETPTSAASLERKRRNEVRNALASVRMEGLEPPKEGHALMNRYISGELSAEQLSEEFEKLLKSLYPKQTY